MHLKRVIRGAVSWGKLSGSLKSVSGSRLTSAAWSQVLTPMLASVRMPPTLPRVARARLTAALSAAAGQAIKYLSIGADTDKHMQPSSPTSWGFNSAPDDVVFTTSVGTVVDASAGDVTH